MASNRHDCRIGGLRLGKLSDGIVAESPGLGGHSPSSENEVPRVCPAAALGPVSKLKYGVVRGCIQRNHAGHLQLLRLCLRGFDRGARHPIRGKIADMKLEVLSLLLRLDCLSCVLTVFSTILVGRRCWEGWALAAANSLIICVIGLRTAQLAFIPANLFCIVLYAVNLRTWRKAEIS